MHVLMTADTVGGVWTYACDLVSVYLKSGVDVSLVCLGRRFTESQRSDVRILGKNGPGVFECISTDYKLEWMEDCEEELGRSADFLCKVIEDHAPDILHLNQFCYGALPVGIPKIVVAHSDVISWWHAVYDADPEELDWIHFYRRIVAKGLEKADVVVVPTAWMGEQIQSIYGDISRIRVIPNGSDAQSLDCNKQKCLRAVSVGRLWDAGKQVRMLEQVQTKIPIYVAGDITPPGRETLHHGHSMNGVQYLGALPRDDVRNLLATSKIYIVTSRYEPFGLAPVEAALCGCAVIANDLSSLREIWGDSILYFEQNNPDALSAILDRLAIRQDEIVRAANRARDHALSHLEHKQMAEHYLQLYGEFV
jgi:glycogen synthase